MTSRTLQYLMDSDLAGVYWPGVLTALAVALMCSILSPLVVLKRLSFVGQGVSHAAFGGVGLALLMGTVWATAATPMPVGVEDAVMLAVVAVFCIASAMAIAWLTDRSGVRADTAIGIVLVASMAVGFLLLQVAGQWRRSVGLPPGPSLESVLFGSIFDVSVAGAVVAWAVAAGIGAVAWIFHRPIVFWAFDEPAAEAFGVPIGRMKLLVMILLALAIVVTMRLAGLILASALLVLPGAAAVQLSRRSLGVLAWSVGLCVVSLIVGIVIAFEVNLQVGPTVVVMLTLLFAGARAAAAIRTASPKAA